MKRFTLSITVLFTLLLTTQLLWAQSAKISFQGVLRDNVGRSVADGTYALTFKFYTAATGGTQVGSNIAKNVTVENGVYSVILDSTDLTGIPFNADYFVAVVYNGVEFPTRGDLTASPYAMSLLGTSNIFPGSGSVGIGITNPTFDLCIGDNDTGIDQLSDGVLAIKTNNTQRIRINSNGNVAIGANTTPAIDLAIGDDNSGLNFTSNDSLGIYTNGVERMRFDSSGKVGIGTNAPSTRLHFKGTTATDAVFFLEPGDWNGAGDYAEIRFGDTSHYIRAEHSTGMTFHDTDRFYFSGSRVGIGTNDPQAMLDVRGTNVNWNHGANADQYYYDGQSNDNNASTNVVAYFDNWIMIKNGLIAAQSPTLSDARAKVIIGQSHSDADLKKLQQIKVTDFRWIDKSLCGDKVQKKVIAQELKEVYPEAITYVEKAIPNVYENAADFQYNADNRLLTITTTKRHGFVAGDFVDIYVDAGDLSKTEVKEIISENTFAVSCEHKPKGVFVYGKWVNDFHIVDYDAIAMLNVSATQELARENEALKAKVTALEAKVAELEQLKTRFAQVEAMLKQQPAVKQTSLH